MVLRMSIILAIAGGFCVGVERFCDKPQIPRRSEVVVATSHLEFETSYS